MDINGRKRVLDVLKTPEMQKIIESKDFYFQKARDAFSKLMEYDNRQLI